MPDELTDQESESTNDKDTDQEPFDEARARALIEKLRPFEKEAKHAKQLEKDLQNTRSALQKINDEKLSESEKTTQRLAALEKQLEDERGARKNLQTKTSLITAATKAGAMHPEKVIRLVDVTDEDLEDDGSLRSGLNPFKTLKEEIPELFKNSRGSADGGPRGKSADGAADMNAAIRRMAGRT
jgi:chromosome segregation ATPase